jgi:hypothetical protein
MRAITHYWCNITGARARAREVHEAEVIVGGEQSDDSDAELEVYTLYNIHVLYPYIYIYMYHTLISLCNMPLYMCIIPLHNMHYAVYMCVKVYILQ